MDIVPFGGPYWNQENRTSIKRLWQYKAISATSTREEPLRWLERWWIGEAKKMEKAFAAWDNRTYFQPIWSTDSTVLSFIHSSVDVNDGWSTLVNSSVKQGLSEPEWTVNLDCSTREVELIIANLKRDKSDGPVGIPPISSKEGGEPVISNLTQFLRIVWNEKIPEERSSSTVIPIFKNGTRKMCENHRGISLVSVASKILSSHFTQTDLTPRTTN